MDQITVTGVVPAPSAAAVAAAFLDPAQHAAMTGAPATGDGARFTAWGGYIQGVTLAAGPPIVQRWRTADFPDDAPDSLVEIHLLEVEGGVEVRFEHREIPDGQGAAYRGGWVEHYLEPMGAWFSR